jgi:hypothetical protein
MKKVFSIRLLFLLSAFSLISCTKNTTEVQLTGKWKLDSLQLLTYTNGIVNFETFYRPATDYYNFGIDNKLYRHLFSAFDTVPYELISLNGQQYIKYAGRITDTIKTLTSHSLLFINPQGGSTKFYFSKQ